MAKETKNQALLGKYTIIKVILLILVCAGASLGVAKYSTPKTIETELQTFTYNLVKNLSGSQWSEESFIEFAPNYDIMKDAEAFGKFSDYSKSLGALKEFVAFDYFEVLNSTDKRVARTQSRYKFENGNARVTLVIHNDGDGVWKVDSMNVTKI